MKLFRSVPAAVCGLLLAAPLRAEEPVVFRSEVALVRVDAQVTDADNRAITGLQPEDFVLRVDGQQVEIRNFATEEMPVDILLLLDVSGSMQTHVQRISDASRDALAVLGRSDRVAIMVFDRGTRVRMPFRSNPAEIESGLRAVLAEEDFNGGTDITRGIVDAAAHMRREGRKDARRAIVILTDDQTERDRDERRAGRELAEADAVLSALIAPDAMGYRRGRSTGGSWPGGGWPSSDPLGDIIFGRRGPWGRRPSPPVTIGSQTHSAGTESIARASGGDAMNVDDAAALETTFQRLRQRYALHFNLPEGAGEDMQIAVELTAKARRSYRTAEVRFRRMGAGAGEDEAPVIARRPRVSERTSEPQPEGSTGGWGRAEPDDEEEAPRARRPAVQERSSEPRPSVADGPAAPAESKPRGGWRRVEPGEEP